MVVVGSYSSAVVQSVYFTTPADWAKWLFESYEFLDTYLVNIYYNINPLFITFNLTINMLILPNINNMKVLQYVSS